MSGKSRIKLIGAVTACVVGSALLFAGVFTYVTKWRIGEIDVSGSPDGTRELAFQSVGEPDWPFGASHARLVLREGGKTLTKYRFDVANDGGTLGPENWSVSWEAACVKAVLSGEEQPDATYVLGFDGTVTVLPREEESVPVEEKTPAEPQPGPTETIETTVPDLSELVCENAAGESVFAVTAEDYVRFLNAVYRQTHGKDLLTSPDTDAWERWREQTPRFGYDAVRNRFSEDPAVWPMPTLSLYTSGEDEIYEIRLTFDHHGYQKSLYEKFAELSRCALRLSCPELSEEELGAFFEELYDSAEENFFGDHHAYGDPERSPLTEMTRYERIGVYSFYGSGTVEICFCPLTENALERLEEEGTELIDPERLEN